MLTIVFASLLSVPPAGGTWSVKLRPAMVVPAEEVAQDAEIQVGRDAVEGHGQEAPRLAPAKTLAPRTKTRKIRPSAQAKPQER
jgi:hypothetical protein